MSANRLAALRAGLKFCSKDHRPVIQAMIDQLLEEYPERRSGTAREAPGTGMRDGKASVAFQPRPPAFIGVQPAASPHSKRVHHGGTEGAEDRPSEGCLAPPARRVDAERADAPPRPPCLRGDPDGARPARDVAPGERWAFIEHRSLAETPAVIVVADGGGLAEDWHAARQRLRRAGHEVLQLDGIVYVDGLRSDDPSLRAV